MGNQLTGIAPSQIFPVEYYLADLPDCQFDANLGSTRFFKVARAKHKEGLIVVKVFAIRDPSLPLKVHKDRLIEIKKLLKDVPNAIAFQKFVLSEKAGMLLRAYAAANLYDRISTRPFLTAIEKRWIAFQLLHCLSQCHRLAVYHGDIKLENIMVTSWNWVLLTDFASYKPTNLAEDNPADFSYFFDTSRRRTCYVAPERFVRTMTGTNVATATTTLSSSGSTIGRASPSLIIHADEIKTGDLTPAMDIFSLGCALTELFTEGSSPFDFSQLLRYRIDDYDPTKVLDKIEDSNLKKLVASMMQKDPAARLNAHEYLDLQRGKAFPEYFYTFLNDYMTNFALIQRSSDEKIYRLKKDIGHIIAAITSHETPSEAGSEGLILIASLLTSLLRALTHCSAKLSALDIIKALSPHLGPDIILDRLLPYLVFMANDKYPKVRVAVIHTLTECLSLIKSIPRSDSNIFPEYILPNLAQVAHDEAVIVRMAYAENIASLAETALGFLEMTQSDMVPDPDSTFLSDDEKNHHNKVSYDHELQALQELVQQSVTTLLSDSVNAVKQTLLERGIRRLCVFFGRQKGNDVLLSHMITYLNDKEDRHLRAAFFDAIVGVATYVGWQCCPILKPLLQQGLTDPEEFVVSKALGALADLTRLGLLQKQMLYDLLWEAIPLLIHPNLWIKQAAVGFICVVAKTLNLADVQCRLIPLLQPFLKMPIVQVQEEVVLLHCVQEPLSRGLLDYLLRLPALRNLLDSLCERKILRSVARQGHAPNYREMDPSLTQVYKRLQSDGMTETIEEQILAMKDHLIKVQAKKAGDMIAPVTEKNSGEINISKFLNPPPTHSIPLIFTEPQFEKPTLTVPSNRTQKKKTVESPTINMNVEWQHMFGTDPKNPPSSPKLQHQDFESSLNSFPKAASSDGLEFVSTVDGKNSPITLSVIEDIKPNHCTPCREELAALVRKKQEEWVGDEVARRASEHTDDHPGATGTNRRAAKVPTGQLIAHLQEHRGAVNRIQVIQDTALFVTCSNDGTVKVWDCEKMEGKNVANRSRLTYNRFDSPVSCMTMCQNMQSVAAASENGSIHVFRICMENMKSNLIHTRELDPIEEGCVVDIDYFDTGSQLVLAYATVTGSIVGWDLRSPGTAWKLENDPRQGLLTSFCTDPQHCWLVVGTARGNISCWDLRFQLPITTITHPSGLRVCTLLAHPRRRPCVLASVQGNAEVSLWDLETQARPLALWPSTAPPLSRTEISDECVLGMCWAGSGGEALFAGGTDRRVRYWDLRNPSASRLLVPAASDPPTTTTSFSSSSAFSYSSRVVDGTEVICETSVWNSSREKGGSEGRYPDLPPAGHYDSVAAVATLTSQQPLLVTAARDGVVKVWK